MHIGVFHTLHNHHIRTDSFFLCRAICFDVGMGVQFDNIICEGGVLYYKPWCLFEWEQLNVGSRKFKTAELLELIQQSLQFGVL